MSKEIELSEIQAGVYGLSAWPRPPMRLIVLSEIPPAEHNLLWNLYSGVPEKVGFALERYGEGLAGMSTLLDELLASYGQKGRFMAYTIDDFRKDYLKKHLRELSPEEIMEVLSAEELLKDLPPEERLKGLPPEERLKGLSIETIRAYLEKLERKKKP
ncbi:MAG: hypothetical protein D6795_12525 [Deltaproteobacteria bacterium]|nr:MAG: hypothetical protein D6795_12525 [Deltaproteobacteria bacterium]